jgi:hypothetical protein
MLPPEERFRTINGFHGAVPMENGAPPSSYAVAAVVNGERGGIPRLIGVTGIRALMIVPGIWIADRMMRGEGPPLSILRTGAFSLAASTTISLGLLALYKLKSVFANPTPTAPSASEP